MLSPLLLAGKFLFLVVLYLFVFMVVRSGARELRSVGRTGLRPGEGSASVSVAAPVGAASSAAAGGRAIDRESAWALVAQDGPILRRGSVVAVMEGQRVVIGRAPESDVVLDDTFVSARHASVEAVAEGLVVEDLGSTNGTFVDGREVTDTLFVGPGASVAIGDTVFRVEER